MSFFDSTAALQWACRAALFAFGSALITGLLSYRRISQYFGVLGVAASGLAVFLVCWQAQRPPLMGLYETVGQMVFLLGGLALWDRFIGNRQSSTALWCWGLSALMLAMLFFYPVSLTPDSFMFDYVWLILFFQLRLVAMALLLFAVACYLAAWGPDDSGATRLRIRRGRIFVLIGWAAFLASEYSGATWSYNWLGDFWNWNAGFMESTLLFLVIAVPLHLPRSWKSNRRVLIAAGAVPGLVVTTVTFVHQVGLS